jgi:hypothetical protein
MELLTLKPTKWWVSRHKFTGAAARVNGFRETAMMARILLLFYLGVNGIDGDGLMDQLGRFIFGGLGCAGNLLGNPTVHPGIIDRRNDFPKDEDAD